MSQINVNRIKDSNEGAPDFPSGVNVSGVTSTVTLGVTNLNATNLNVLGGVCTATTFDGSLPAAGTPTLGLGVTINASGLNISGVATAGIVSATTLYGDGTNITGIALSIAPLNYNPALNSQSSHLTKALGIGLTFNQGVKAGSGNVTLSLANAGVAGTVVENFSVGSSVSYPTGDSILITPTADLSVGQNYHLSYPSGAFTSLGGDVSYVGTAYTFQGRKYDYQLWSWGDNENGALAQNRAHDSGVSSPVQVPGLTWGNSIATGKAPIGGGAVKSDGTLWMWGYNSQGQLGDNSEISRSSPTQVPGTTWAGPVIVNGESYALATKTDGTLWGWGRNSAGVLGHSIGITDRISSPVQVSSSTTWPTDIGSSDGVVKMCLSDDRVFAIKTDGTLWAWGTQSQGQLGQNQQSTKYSSPVQIPGTWSSIPSNTGAINFGVKSNGTAYFWGSSDDGASGTNNKEIYRSSPTQIPGTTWKHISSTGNNTVITATKTDGTLWAWGNNAYGTAGYVSPWSVGINRSSPIQVDSATNWKFVEQCAYSTQVLYGALKTDGTLWAWGVAPYGGLGNNLVTPANAGYSSPVQVPGTDWATVSVSKSRIFATKQI